MALISFRACSPGRPALLLFARLKQRADLREREHEREQQRAFVSPVFVGVFLQRWCWRSAVPRDPPHHHLDQLMAALGFRGRHPTPHRTTLQAIKLSLKQTHSGGVCEHRSECMWSLFFFFFFLVPTFSRMGAV